MTITPRIPKDRFLLILFGRVARKGTLYPVSPVSLHSVLQLAYGVSELGNRYADSPARPPIREPFTEFAISKRPSRTKAIESGAPIEETPSISLQTRSLVRTTVLYATFNQLRSFACLKMQIADDDVAELKTWIVKKLENM